ncbi:MAG: cell wall hydrolase [Muribaculum sp.]|nr:cell wall hydrolase [Muribaculum sp.]
MRRTKRALAVLLALALAAALQADGAPGAVHVLATGTREQIDQTQREKDELEGKKGELEEDIEGLKDERNTLRGELKDLNTQMSEISDRLEDLAEQIADKEQEIVDTQAALEDAKKTEEDQYENMILRVRKMYERNDPSSLNAFIGTALGTGSFADMLNAADSFEKIASYDKIQLDEYKENRRLIEEREELLLQEKKDLDDLVLKAETEKSKVSGLIGQMSNSIATYSDKISEAEEQALAYEAEIKKKEEDLEYLRKKLAEELALSQEAADGQWRDISEVVFEEGDRKLLANLIYCEAGGEPYAGQLAVGSVVINRVLSEKFPDSVLGVIYQNRQFSPVASGRLALALGSNKATASCYRAADEAMAGVTNVGNCVYFRTPIDGLTGISIGGHIFY